MSGLPRRPVRPPWQREAVVDRGVLQEVPGEGRVHRQALRQLHCLQPRGGWLLSDLQTNGEATEICQRWTSSSIVVVLSVQVNGRLTLGENIADMGGLKLSYYVSDSQEKWLLQSRLMLSQCNVSICLFMFVSTAVVHLVCGCVCIDQF